MILSDDEVESRMGHDDNLINVIVRPARPGRPQDSGNIPPMVRGLIGLVANSSDDNQKEVAEVFDVSQATVSKTARGMIGERLDSVLKGDVQPSKDLIDQRIDNVHAKALDALMATMEVIAPRVIQDAPTMKVRELSKIAVDLSSIAKNVASTGRDKSEEVGPRTMVQIVVQPLRSESDYDVIAV